MTTTTLPYDARTFADAVRAELADLPDDEAAELLEDVEQHLAEAVADGRLAELGSPTAYAAELRSAAGLPARQHPALGWAPVRLAQRAAGRARDTRAYAQVRAFLPELRPGWWVVRGYLAAVALAALTHDSMHQVVPVPHVSGNALLGLLATAAAVVGSVAWGRRATHERLLRVATVAANVAALVVAVSVAENVEPVGTRYQDPYSYVSYPGDGLVGPAGPVTDLLPYDAAGNPLDGVHLYTQDGTPIAASICGQYCTRLTFPLTDVPRVPLRKPGDYGLPEPSGPPSASLSAKPSPAP